jgi:hypothetical protein
VTLTEDECVIQALSPSRSHPSLGDRIVLRRSERGADLSDTKALEPTLGYLDMHDFSVAVTNHEEDMERREENCLHAH